MEEIALKAFVTRWRKGSIVPHAVLQMRAPTVTFDLAGTASLGIKEILVTASTDGVFQVCIDRTCESISKHHSNCASCALCGPVKFLVCRVTACWSSLPEQHTHQ